MRRTYGRYCTLARALDVVGERWTLLIVRDVATQAADAGEGGASVASAPDESAVEGLDPDVASIEHRAMAGLREAVNHGVLLRWLDPHRRVSHAVAGESRAQQPAEGAVRGDRGDVTPPLKAAVCGEDLTEQRAHAGAPAKTALRTPGSP